LNVANNPFMLIVIIQYHYADYWCSDCHYAECYGAH
jgi:hypothetical protein